MGFLVAMAQPLLLVIVRGHGLGGFFVAVPPDVGSNEGEVQVREALHQGRFGSTDIASVGDLLAAQAAHQNFRLEKTNLSVWGLPIKGKGDESSRNSRTLAGSNAPRQVLMARVRGETTTSSTVLRNGTTDSGSPLTWVSPRGLKLEWGKVVLVRYEGRMLWLGA